MTPYIAFNSANKTLWVADRTRLLKISQDGRVLFKKAGFKDLKRVVVQPFDSSIWVREFDFEKKYSMKIGDEGSREVIKVNSKGEELFRIKDHIWPEVFVNPYTDNCWVASDYKISKYSSDGTLLFQKKGYEGAVDISINPIKDTCWVYYHAFPG